MDRSRPPHPFTRPPDRSLGHAHNHSHSVHSTPSSDHAPPYASSNNYPPTSSQGQSTPQPPLHVPFSADPYPTARRDPFLPPTSQHVRRSSYGVHPAESAPSATSERAGAWANTARAHGSIHHAPHQHSQSGPPPPPSMNSSHTSSGPPYGYDTARRRSLGGQSPPNPYGAPSHDAPPPPPPSFSRPHMPPPSSPQQQQQQQQHSHSHAPSQQPQRAPYSAANNFGRELPGLSQAHRPGSSMSISSLIGGGDTGAPTPSSQSQSSPPTTAQPSNHHSMHPPSPRRQLSSGQRTEFPPFRRQPSPERHPYPNPTSRPPEAHGYPAGSPPRSYSNQGSPEQGRQSLPQASQPYKPMLFQNQRPYTSSPNDAHARDPRQSSGNIPPRPNSQPTGPPGPPEQDPRAIYDTLGGRRTTYGPPEERRRTLGESHHARPNAAELLAGTSQSTSDRDRPVTVQPVSHSAFSPPRDHRAGMLNGPAQQPHRNAWRHSAPEEALHESTDSRREEPLPMYRGYGGYPPSSQAPPPQYASHGGAEDMVRGRSLDHLSHRVVEQYHAPPTSDPTSHDRQRSEQLSRSLSSGGSAYPGRSMYDQPRSMGVEMQHSKSHLGLEASRRTGRASPLPQAVQGAQAQPLSIGKDPNIKSEFGRMFSGLGSGLGTSTPSRGSPMPQGGQESIPPGTDLNEVLRLQRVNSQNGRKPKRVKDEEGAIDSESVDGRGTPSLRGAKRNKHNHAGHHHHHHAHPHHHHHHHHRPEDELPPSTTSTPFNGRQANVPANGASKGSAHHHHHYHAGAHHHHHAPQPNQAGPLPSPTKIPPKIHDIQAVLDDAAKLPRRHLGSHLYQATTQLPKPNSSLDDQFGYASKPNRLPRFETNPINCTFTIRVPRFYLKPRQRQQIVLERHLWGARIYRDDSDPIAAAIHSGWIRGEWDDTVDVSMLDPRITAPNDPSDAEATLTKLPAAPVTPPADMDLQIEILILPRIQEYAGTVEYGISSQKSKTHDGLSFVIHKIRWVEEDIGSRGQERTAAALKRRLDASATLLALKSGVDGSFRAVNGATKLHA